jgi:hypothetical protein
MRDEVFNIVDDLIRSLRHVDAVDPIRQAG